MTKKQLSKNMVQNIKVLTVEPDKMSSLKINDDVNTSYTIGAIDDHSESVKLLEMPITKSLTKMTTDQCMQKSSSKTTTTTTLSSSSTLSLSSSSSSLTSHCSYGINGDNIVNDEMHATKSHGQTNSFKSNMHKNGENPTSFSDKMYRLATNSCDLNQCINETNINDTNDSNQNVSALKSNNNQRKSANQRQRSYNMNFSHVLLLLHIIPFMLFGTKMVMADDAISPENTSQLNITESGICYSKDVRNTVKNFQELKGCRVIEGFLIVTLIDRYEATDYDDLEFPLLTEVTGFILFYRVNGLRSLGKLFPNLRIIRGNDLLYDSSLIIFEMMHLQEIGLKSLMKIVRGSVRIAKNPQLCFYDTIDWSIIASASKENVIISNKEPSECPTCPGNINENHNEILKQNVEQIICPESSGKRVCWNHQQCQTICPLKCGNSTCNSKGECCDEQCIGCAEDNTRTCLSCRYLSMGDGSNRQCVEKCPSNLYTYGNRRCVTEAECYAIKKPVFLKIEHNLSEYPYIPRNDGKCEFDCPSNFYPDGPSGKRVCVKCDGPCKKECPSANIENISDAQRYQGCTHVTGAFTISIRNSGGHNVVKELETFLADIEVIEGPLSIVRSFSLLSLSFFKKLRIIQGANKPNQKYGIRIVENQNLQTLFTNNVTVEKGRMFFHFNPKLCMNVIEEFKQNVVDMKNLTQLPIDEVPPNSNGDKTACNVEELKVKLTKVTNIGAVLELTPMVYDDERQLLGYMFHYMPAPYQNVSMYDNRDACGGDGWQIDDVAVNKPNETNPTITLLATLLKPFTQYAYFVKTYTVASEKRGGLSKIQYFRTLPDKPDPVTKLMVSQNGSSELVVKWGPPVHANGNLTRYTIRCRVQPEDPNLLEQRNYCYDPLRTENNFNNIPITVAKPTEVKPSTKEKIGDTDVECACSGADGRERKITDEEAEQLIQFEDELHNTVYVRQDFHADRRRRRDLSSQTFMNSTEIYTMALNHYVNKRSIMSLANTSDPEIFPSEDKKHGTEDEIDLKKNIMDATNTSYLYYTVDVNASVHSVTIKNLRHYTSYSVVVIACHDGDPQLGTTENNCGNEQIVYQRTAKLEDADDVKYMTVEKIITSNSSGVKLTWAEPEQPNGMIVSYNIRFIRVDIEHAKSNDFCIAQNLYVDQGRSHTIMDLQNGNYSFTILANSLSGPNSRWSKPVFCQINESWLTWKIVFWSTLFLGGVVSCIGFFAWFFKKKYDQNADDLKIIATVNPDYVTMQYTPDEWEIPREKILQLNELGQGSFGMVYEGVVLNLDKKRERVRCAIKTVNENATDRERINFLKEAGVMKAFNTQHVVRLLGVVSQGQPVLVIMELMVNGDLKGFLRSHRPESDNDVQPPSLRQILQMAIEIADGMAYLAAKKFVHRDLAARNCMVAEDYTVKIGDFGMTRDIYETDYYRKGTKGLLPVRWMAPESLKDGVFSTSSDVFSFGIVLWEMATLASQPYQGLSNDQVLRYVIDGGVMERPENCPERLYQLMCRCWQHRPTARPTFMQIITMLLDEAKPNFEEVSFYHSQPGRELLQHPIHQQQTEVVDVRTPLRAEEENFSVGVDVDDDDDADPNSFLMAQRNISHPSANGSIPSSSPLR